MNFAKYCKQYAVYWAPSTPDAYGGTAYTDGVELAVRWENVQDQIYTDTGEVLIATNYVMCLQDLEVGGLLWKGQLADWTGGTPTPQTENVHRIVKTTNIPDIRADTFLREAYM